MRVLAAVGVFAVSIALLPGNLLALAPILGVWAYSNLAFSERSGNAGGHYAGKVCVPTQRWGLRTFTLVLWATAIAIGGYRLTQTPLATGQELGRQMSEAETLFHTGDPRVALEAFRAIEVPGAFPARLAQKFHNIGVISMHLERWDEAAEAFAEALRYDRSDFDAWYNLARLAVRKKQYKAAAEYLHGALHLQQGHAGAWLLVAQCFMETGEYKDALVAVRRAEMCAAKDSPLHQPISDLKKRIALNVSLSD